MLLLLPTVGRLPTGPAAAAAAALASSASKRCRGSLGSPTHAMLRLRLRLRRLWRRLLLWVHNSKLVPLASPAAGAGLGSGCSCSSGAAGAVGGAGRGPALEAGPRTVYPWRDRNQLFRLLL